MARLVCWSWADADVAPTQHRGRWHLVWNRLRCDRTALLALSTIAFIVLVALCAPLISRLTGHPPAFQDRVHGLSPEGLPRSPSWRFLLGSDDLGRDVLVRVAYGARVSLAIGVLTTIFSMAIGLTVGLVAGLTGGVVDAVLARLIDVALSFPSLLLAICLVSVIGPGVAVTAGVIAAFSWAAVARLVRGQTLAISARDYVKASALLGASRSRILMKDVLPNLLGEVLVYGALLLPTVILAEATLSFLGLGVPPPASSWGSMLSDSVPYYRQAWWFVASPAIALVCTTVALNILGESIRNAVESQPFHEAP
jgi:ABC-type dipeptide/oligopeptide/nickel transport system permease subunit